MNFAKTVIIFTICCGYFFSLTASATPSGGNSERQTLLTVDETSYSVLSIERLGHTTHFRFTNRISIKRYLLDSNELLDTSILMEAQIDSTGKWPPEPMIASETGAELTTLQSMFGNRAGGFVGYVRKPKYQIKVSSDGLFMDKQGKRYILMTPEQLQLRITDYLQLANYDALEVVGIQGPASSHYFLVVRSNVWGSDVGSFEQIVAIPN